MKSDRVHLRLGTVATALITVLLVGTSASLAGEWTSWRGPSYNGTSFETGLISTWSPEGENVLWKADFIGRSTPVVFDGRACATGRVGEGVERQEVVACWDAEGGRKLWEDRFNVYNTTVPFNRVGWASPVGDPETGYLYLNGVAGQLHAYDRDGKIVWSRFVAEELGRLSGYGGRTQTPVIDGDQLLISSVSSNWGSQAAPRHRYFSFDKRTGAVNWIATPGGMPYDMNTQSVPVVAEIGGRRLLVSGSADGWIYALDVASGEKVWAFQLSRRGINSSVIVVGDRVYASHSEENLDDAYMGRLVCIDGTGKGDVTKTHEVWRINELSQGFPSPTYHDGRLFVVDNSANMYAIDAATGEIAWEYSIGTVGKASPVFADGKIYVTETNGRFHIIEPGKESARELSQHELQVAGGRYAEIYGSPAIAYGRVYFTTEGGIYCLGDENAPFRVEKKRRVKKRKVKPSKAAPATLRVFPGEILVRPGDKVDFEARAFDANGHPIGSVPASWTLKGLQGTIKDGRFEAEDEVQFQAGSVVAKVGDLEATSMVRSISDLPWSWTFEDFKAGEVPPYWVGAKVKYKVEDKDGNKVLTKLFREKGLLRNALYMGPSTLSNYTIEADVMGAKKGRRHTDVGVIAGGYTLDLQGNRQKLQVRSWPSENRITQDVEFPWEMGKWYHLKLRVDVDDDRALVRGKVWLKGESEPSTWTITVEDPLPIQSGSPGLVGYSPADLYYDNIKVTVNQ